MATTGLLSGRSRHTTRKVRSHHSSKASTRPRKRKEEEDGEVVKRPDLDELRQRRSAYYSVAPAERRRASSATTAKTKSRQPSSTTLRSSASAASERRHKKRKRKSSSSNAERSVSESETRTEDYVYGPRPSVGTGAIEEDTETAHLDRRRSEKRPSRHSSSSHRRSLPTVLETEVTPDDSISQVAGRNESETPRVRAHVRPSLRRSSTTSTKLPSIPESQVDTESVTTSRRSSRRESTLLGSVFRRHSTSAVPTPPRLVECLTCGSDDIPSTQSVKLACSHRMCHDCLKRVFEMSVKDPAHMPPKCCTDQHIPLKHVDKLFDVNFKMLWNRKYQEYHTKNRIYCPTLKCGEWIKPSHIHSAQGRKFALCPRCKMKVCTLCNNRLHKSSDCPKDPEIAKLVEQAKEKGWQRCFNCSALVEKKEGCNHMTCRCMAEFCIVCGAKWKTCDCPWFNYGTLPNPDRLNDMRVPEPIQVIYRQVFRAAVDPMAPPPPVPAPGAATPARRGPPPEATYQQELDQRRRQERLDADLARRLQLASLMDPEDENHARRQADPETWGLGNAADHVMNDDFVRNAANVVMRAFGDTNLGRRGERQSGRRRRARHAEQNDGDPGLVPNFLGDESVLGVGPATRSARRRD